MATWRSIILALMVGLAGCDSETGLSPVETEAYLVLMDQIAERPDGPPLTSDIRICVAINTDADPSGIQTRRVFVERLRTEAPTYFKTATLAPISECVGTST